MRPNKQQQEAIDLGVKWFLSGSKQVFVISGYAGTGKTTIVKWIMEACGLPISSGLYITFVGKAALVLTLSGLPAKTIHSTIYKSIIEYEKDVNGKPKLDENGMVRCYRKFVLVDSLPSNIKLIIIDEGSMVSQKLFEDIKSFGIPIIVLGDPHQLPPVFGKSDLLQNPDIELTDIMRQAQDNPIIYFATMARLQKWNEFVPGSYKDSVFILEKEKVLSSKKLLTSADVIICGRNKTREELNNYIRSEIYKRDEFTIGDKLICRENDWTKESNGIYLINGLIGTVIDIYEETFTKRFVNIDFKTDSAYFRDIPLDWKYLNLSVSERKNYYSEFNKFEYGYAITCHLSQGSQYEKVILFNEKISWSNADYSKWLYTGITRAIKKLIIAV